MLGGNRLLEGKLPGIAEPIGSVGEPVVQMLRDRGCTDRSAWNTIAKHLAELILAGEVVMTRVGEWIVLDAKKDLKPHE